MRWHPISDLDRFSDFELLLCVNSNRRGPSGVLEPLVLEGWCVRALRESLAKEPSMPPHLRFGFTHFMLQDDLLKACPLPTE